MMRPSTVPTQPDQRTSETLRVVRVRSLDELILDYIEEDMKGTPRAMYEPQDQCA